jgi:serine/threonine-protein kinase HipA
MLSALGDTGLGALSFPKKERSKGEEVSATLPDLQALVDAAYQYDAGETVDEDSLRLLFRSASSPGGARPKALVVDEKGDHWIAKFPSVRDLFDMIPVEAATLRLADEAGLAVPQSTMLRVGSRNVLLVKRFDVTKTAGRRHMISLQTLLGAEGYYNFSYLDLFDVLRRYSDQPAIDIPLLFRQMTFNAVIGNTDDHLKNFTVLHDDRGFHLSPAYDLMPDVAGSREHVLRFENDFTTPNRKTLLRIADRLGVSKPNEIIEGVVDSVSRWKDVFKVIGVPAGDIRRLNWGIADGLKRLAG